MTILRGKDDVALLLKSMARFGDHVSGTHEYVCEQIRVPGLKVGDMNQWESQFGTNTYLVTQLLNAIEHSDVRIVNDVYDSLYYTFLKSECDWAGSRFKENGLLTRQAVIFFPTNHCFESIQMMVRNKKLLIVVNMRSCNAYKNLLCDLCLSYCLAMRVAAKVLSEVDECDMIANIGSLHLFEEDVQDVLRDA